MLNVLNSCWEKTSEKTCFAIITRYVYKAKNKKQNLGRICIQILSSRHEMMMFLIYFYLNLLNLSSGKFIVL